MCLIGIGIIGSKWHSEMLWKLQKTAEIDMDYFIFLPFVLFSF